ncbi:MAG: DEAD/DEAH box helicase, partial [Bacteroidales bacterium]|nr:DEAD/DEAH box helicase [Bacteroidales bacterium]
MTFSEFDLRPEILSAIESLGFVQPMPVQEKVLPVLLSTDTDMVALAQTGTGKTAAFGLPLLQKCNPDKPSVEALVLSPTRELCMQIAKDLKNFAQNIKNLRICAVYGGASIERQLDEIARG